MRIKLRLPNGENLILMVDPNEKAQYLFDFVNIQDKDMGFENDDLRSMSIMRPYDKLNLTELKNQTLKEAFEGSDSQTLVVAEL